MANIDFWSLLQQTQEYLSRNYAAALTDRDKSGQLKNYIDKYLRDNNYHVDGMDTRVLTLPRDGGIQHPDAVSRLARFGGDQRERLG